MRRGWQITPYTSHNLRMDLKEMIRCLQRGLSLFVSVSCSYIVTLIWSWDRETTPTAVGWEHNTMTVSQTNHSSSVMSVLSVDICTVGVNSSWQRFCSESVYLCVNHLYLCRERGVKEQVCSRLSVLILAWINGIACFQSLTFVELYYWS